MPAPTKVQSSSSTNHHNHTSTTHHNNGTSRVRCVDLNDLITCSLCHGYLIDATTIIECLHSFCKTCIVKHLKTNNTCPRTDCKKLIHETKPYQNIRLDPTLQDIVYKIVPGLYKKEMERRRKVYEAHPDIAKTISSGEEKGQVSGERIIYSPDDVIPFSLQYLPEEINYTYTGTVVHSQNIQSAGPSNGGLPSAVTTTSGEHGQIRYFRCVSAVTVRILKKLLRSKFDLKYHHDVELFYKHDPLYDDYTILDLAYIYSWKRTSPLPLYYKITDLRSRTDTPTMKKLTAGLTRQKKSAVLKQNDALGRKKTTTVAKVPPSVANAPAVTSLQENGPTLEPRPPPQVQSEVPPPRPQPPPSLSTEKIAPPSTLPPPPSPTIEQSLETIMKEKVTARVPPFSPITNLQRLLPPSVEISYVQPHQQLPTTLNVMNGNTNGIATIDPTNAQQSQTMAKSATDQVNFTHTHPFLNCLTSTKMSTNNHDHYATPLTIQLDDDKEITTPSVTKYSSQSLQQLHNHVHHHNHNHINHRNPQLNATNNFLHKSTRDTHNRTPTPTNTTSTKEQSMKS